MDSLIRVEIALETLIKLKKDHKTIGIWYEAESPQKLNTVADVIEHISIINDIKLPDDKIIGKEYNINLAVIPDSITKGSNFKPTQGSDIRGIKRIKSVNKGGIYMTLCLKESGWECN